MTIAEAIEILNANHYSGHNDWSVIFVPSMHGGGRNVVASPNNLADAYTEDMAIEIAKRYEKPTS